MYNQRDNFSALSAFGARRSWINYRVSKECVGWWPLQGRAHQIGSDATQLIASQRPPGETSHWDRKTWVPWGQIKQRPVAPISGPVPNSRPVTWRFVRLENVDWKLSILACLGWWNGCNADGADWCVCVSVSNGVSFVGERERERAREEEREKERKRARERERVRERERSSWDDVTVWGLIATLTQ